MLVSARSCACSAKKTWSSWPYRVPFLISQRIQRWCHRNGAQNPRKRKVTPLTGHVFQDGGNSKDDIELFKIKILNVLCKTLRFCCVIFYFYCNSRLPTVSCFFFYYLTFKKGLLFDELTTYDPTALTDLLIFQHIIL